MPWGILTTPRSHAKISPWSSCPAGNFHPGLGRRRKPEALGSAFGTFRHSLNSSPVWLSPHHPSPQQRLSECSRRPAAPASARNVREMHPFGPTPDPGVGNSIDSCNLCFNKPSRWLWRMSKSEDLWRRNTTCGYFCPPSSAVLCFHQLALNALLWPTFLLYSPRRHSCQPQSLSS